LGTNRSPLWEQTVPLVRNKPLPSSGSNRANSFANNAQLSIFFLANDVWEAKEGKKGVEAAREGGREGGRRLVPVFAVYAACVFAAVVS
jgi:hypothetical protein